jgi:short subunit fatty acids transporter
MEMVFLVCGGRILEECSNGDGILGVWWGGHWRIVTCKMEMVFLVCEGRILED